MSAEWVAAIGQVAGAAFTCAAVVVALGSERFGNRRRERDRVRLVTVQVTRQDRPDDHQVIQEVRIRNDCTSPITMAGVVSVEVVGQSAPSYVTRLTLNLMPSGGNLAGGPDWIQLIKPQETVRFSVASDAVSDSITSPLWPKGKVRAVIQFKDLNGHAWERATDQNPRKIKQVKWEIDPSQTELTKWDLLRTLIKITRNGTLLALLRERATRELHSAPAQRHEHQRDEGGQRVAERQQHGEDDDRQQDQGTDHFEGAERP
jgi:hypothetical protein